MAFLTKRAVAINVMNENFGIEQDEIIAKIMIAAEMTLPVARAYYKSIQEAGAAKGEPLQLKKRGRPAKVRPVDVVIDNTPKRRGRPPKVQTAIVNAIANSVKPERLAIKPEPNKNVPKLVRKVLNVKAETPVNIEEIKAKNLARLREIAARSKRFVTDSGSVIPNDGPNDPTEPEILTKRDLAALL